MTDLLTAPTLVPEADREPSPRDKLTDSECSFCTFNANAVNKNINKAIKIIIISLILVILTINYNVEK